MFTRWGLNQPNLDDVNLEPSKSCVYIDKGDQPSVSDPLKELRLFYFKIEIGLSMLDVTFNSLLYAKPILHLLKVDHVMIVVTMDHVQVTGRQVEATVQDTTA